MDGKRVVILVIIASLVMIAVAYGITQYLSSNNYF